MAATSIEAVRRLHISPLITIQHEVFRDQYEHGLAYSLFEDHEQPGPLHDLYLVDMFVLARNTLHYFDGQHQKELYAHIGLTLGEIHGGVLLSTSGTIRSDVTTLVALSDEEIKRGYGAGREFYFTEADGEQEWHWTEERMLERLCELAQEYDMYQDAKRTIRFSIGSILGELSGRLFPWTPEEHRAVEEESIRVLGYICNTNPRSHAARQFCVQVVS